VLARAAAPRPAGLEHEHIEAAAAELMRDGGADKTRSDDGDLGLHSDSRRMRLPRPAS
jgi:hypothetical protein